MTYTFTANSSVPTPRHTTNRYLSTHHERDVETGWDYRGARWYDGDVGRFLGVDPMADALPHESSYNYSGGNPILFVDRNGELKLKYTEAELTEYGLTADDMKRFENIVMNISNIVANNPQAIAAIANSTGLDPQTILNDMENGSGPSIELYPTDGGISGGRDGIIVDPSIIKTYASIDGSDKDELAYQTLGLALTLIHEYGHYGDQITNDGMNSGQFHYAEGKVMWEYESHTGSIKRGKQKYKVSITGHRGTDIEILGYGVELSLSANGKIKIEKRDKLPTDFPSLPQPPQELPASMRGQEILRTLNVE